MTQLTGAVTVEIDLDRLADLVAARVVAMLRPAGDDAYEREPEPAGRRRGVRYGAVTDHGEVRQHIARP